MVDYISDTDSLKLIADEISVFGQFKESSGFLCVFLIRLDVWVKTDNWPIFRGPSFNAIIFM
jgi:hypothetical protein